MYHVSSLINNVQSFTDPSYAVSSIDPILINMSVKSYVKKKKKKVSLCVQCVCILS